MAWPNSLLSWSGLGKSTDPGLGWKNRPGGVVPTMSPWNAGWEGGGASLVEGLAARPLENLE